MLREPHIVPREILAGLGHAEQRTPFGISEEVASCHGEIRPQKGENNRGHTVLMRRSLWTVLGGGAQPRRRRP